MRVHRVDECGVRRRVRRRSFSEDYRGERPLGSKDARRFRRAGPAASEGRSEPRSTVAETPPRRLGPPPPWRTSPCSRTSSRRRRSRSTRRRVHADARERPALLGDPSHQVDVGRRREAAGRFADAGVHRGRGRRRVAGIVQRDGYDAISASVARTARRAWSPAQAPAILLVSID